MSENREKFNINKLEEEILKFWQKNKIFEKSIEKPAGKKPKGGFVFYDGPPFATGLPHYGHILASIIKDAVPRYQAMKGKKVPRRWGWDCHGLPIENEIEKKLGLKTKKDIERIGIEKFNEAAEGAVLEYRDEWKKIIPRVGRWIDMENDYKTMDWTYTESVWWVFKSLFNKGLIYEGYKPMHLCPRCETTLANFEVTQGYKDITDISVVAKFELEDEPNTFVLAWTTTPWTLPGNVALAVNPDIKYGKVKIKNEFFIVAENLLVKTFPFEGETTLIGLPIKGKDLIGKKYKPLFNYYAEDKNLKNCENGWKIYADDFVTTNEGTGIVHIAPAFGEDDMNLAKKENLPFIQHVGIDGKFKSEVKDFVGLSVKPKENSQATDIEIIKWLAKENKLFKKEKIIHSYPHCWRCDTPLLNYAASSWFVKVEEIKNKLIANNKKINWIPKHIRDGRFGKWLEGARDWAISRSRFWGAPLPAWKCERCDNLEIIGSLDDIKRKTEKSGNRYFMMRHGEGENNTLGVVNTSVKNKDKFSLTEKGKKQVLAVAKKIKKEKIDFIFVSDFRRAKETAELAVKAIGWEGKIIFDKRLREVNTGIIDGKKIEEYRNFAPLEEKFYKTPPEGENLTELKNRVAEFLYEIENKYQNKNILIVSHEYPIWLFFAATVGADAKKAVEIKYAKALTNGHTRINKSDDFIKTGEVKKLDFIPLPHNQNYELDLHRPYIDEMKFTCSCGGEMRRVPEVFDCWFESGSMPYGQAHYPFENNQKFGFPAEFIAEGIDQTRGWFYTLLVLSTGLFNKPAYKNVIVNGIILAEDGQKMSKRLKNYPDPMEIVGKYGADALRLYLLSSPAVRGEDLNFSEKGVDEVYKKIIMRLWNVYQFYDLYADKKVLSVKRQVSGKNILDIWILTRLKQLIKEVSEAMDNYELDKASRPLGEFIDDLSTWYIRRSRERFKTEGRDKQNAIATTRFVLSEFSKASAPFAPFISETLYQSVKCQVSGVRNIESVHLEKWPAFVKTSAGKPKIDKKLIEMMAETRKICSLGLDARQKSGIKVRQPLAKISIKYQVLGIKNNKELLELIKDEVNVKEIIFDKNIASDVELDINITPELKAEGQLRELTRVIQDLRKEADFIPKDVIILNIHADDYFQKLISKNMENLKTEVGAKKIEFAKTDKFTVESETKIDDSEIWLGIKKI
ncbi:MAG: class I tRNA ligase family protein [Patescibacteria group bacterium]